MVIFSSLSRGSLNQIKTLVKSPAGLKIAQNAIQARTMAGHGPKLLPLGPSRFQWHKFKDSLHFFVMIGVIPASALVFYTNVFIGPATLAEIPEDYVPKHWEYHRHPITRFLARYIYPSPQEEYEKMCHMLYEENEKAQIRGVERKVKDLLAERHDYQSYYYQPFEGKHVRISKEAADYLESIRGD